MRNTAVNRRLTRALVFVVVALMTVISAWALFACGGGTPEPKNHDIIVASCENGTVTPSAVKAKKGSEITVAVTPDAGYELKSLKVGDKDITNALRFVMPDNDVTITAAFSAVVREYSITVNTVGAGVVGFLPSKSAAGETITVVATPDDGYELESIVMSDGENHDITADKSFVMPAANVTVTVTFGAIENPKPPATEYEITVASAQNGSVSVDKNKAEEGELVTVTVTPDNGYELDTLTYDDGSVHDIKAVKSFVMPAADVTVIATFKASENPPAPMYDITVAVAQNGNVSVDKNKAEEDELVTVTVTPSAGYELDTLTANGEDIKTAKSFAVGTANVEIVATFKKIVYTVSVAATENGTVIPSAESASIGDEITVAVTPSAGYELDTLTANGEDIKTAKSFTVGTANVEIVATFKKIVYTVSVAETADGTVSVSATAATIGEEITVTATPAFGYRLTALTVGETDILSARKFTMPARNVTVSAVFACVLSANNFGEVSQAENSYKGRTDNIINAIDGDPDTATAFNRTGQTAGGYVEYDLGETREFDRVTVYPGRKARGTGEITDSFDGHVSVVASDGTETNLGSFKKGQSVFTATGFSVTNTPYDRISAVKIRVYVDTLPGGWISISDIVLDGDADGKTVVAFKLGGTVENTALNNVIDGDGTTAARFDKTNVTVGEGYIGIDLMRDVKIEFIRVLNGYNEAGADAISGVVEYFDGAEWVQLGVLGTDLILELDITARYVRVRVTSISAWIGLREIYVNSLGDIKGAVDISHYSNLSNQGGSFKYGLLDGDPTTFAWFENPGTAAFDETTGLHTGKYIDVELFETTEIYQLRVLSDSGNDYFAGYIQYSVDGETWTEIHHITGHDDATLSLEDDQKITAKYLRFVADRATNWSKIYEIYINELGDIEYVYSLDNFGPLFGGTSYSAMFDGDSDTYAHFVKPNVGGTLRIEFSGERTINSLYIATGDATGGDGFTGVVEWSNDGKNYTQIATLSDATTGNYIKLDAAVTPRYLRLRDTGSAHYVAIREIVFNPVNEKVRNVTLEGGFGTMYQGGVSDMFDGDETSLLWFGATPDANSHIQLDLNEEIDVSSVRVLSSDRSEGGDSYRGTITYSTDGETWNELGTVDSNDATVAPASPVKAKYIRIMGGSCAGWVKIRELSVA